MLKNFLALSLSLAVLFLSVVSYIHDTFRRSEQTIVEADEAHTVALQARAVENNLKDIASDLRILASLAESHDPAQRHCLQWLHHTEAQFLNFTLYKQRYDQIRILDRDGMETLRIDDRQGHPKVAPRDQLQSKANRYYFTEAFVLDPGRIYVSPLDLNIERDVIEQPLKPMIRFAMPLFDLDRTRQGVIVINYLARILIADLKRISQGLLGESQLLNQAGYWLMSADPAQEWGFMYPDRQDQTFAKAFPDAWQRISAADSGQFHSPNGLFTFTTVFPRLLSDSSATSDDATIAAARQYQWKIVSHVRPHILQAHTHPSRWMMLIVIMGGLGLLMGASWVIVKIHHRRLRATETLQASETRFRDLSAMTSDWFWEQDEQFRFTYFSSALSPNFIPPAVSLGKTRWELPIELTPAQWAAHRAVLETHQPFRHFEYCIRAEEGKEHWYSINGHPLFDPVGRFIGYRGTGQDITERKQVEITLRLAATVFENAREGVTITDTQERILRVNRAFCEMTGYSEDEAQGQTPRILQSGRHDRDFYAALWADLRANGHWRGEIWNRRKSGEVYPELLSISAVKDETGQITHYVAVFSDLSLIKASEQKAEFLAHYDPLTQLPNRRLLSTRLQHSINVARREGSAIALLMLDLDRFKNVNDSFGHQVGDELLQQVAERLTRRLRGADTLARLGGDEFALQLEGLAHPEDAARFAVEIIAALDQPWRLYNGAEVRMGASVGISLFPDHSQTAEELLQHADAALYRAKLEGRGSFQYFSAELTQAARQRVELEARLRNALVEQQLRVYYQPQIEIASGRIIGAEALVRWQDPDQGLIPPGRFIPVAEETGLISAIGEWVLRETCRQGKAWMDAGLPPLTLAVNLSSHQLRHGDLFATVLQAITDTGFPAEQLELELTESALMQRETEAVAILERLRGLGLRLAMDDFGTGYSSLAYLKRFPLDVLKIDKSFVDDIPHHRDDMEIAATIIAMGHTLGFKVLAEGVETVEQLAFLKLKGCDRYQGYLNSPPVPAEAFAALLTASNTGIRPVN